MAIAKTATLTFGIKLGLGSLARHRPGEHRSIANRVKVLILDDCGRDGVAIPAQRALF